MNEVGVGRFVGGAGNAVMPAQAPPSGGVDQYSRALNEAIEAAHRELDRLFARLEGVLRSVPPSGSAGTKVSEQSISSQLAETLRGQGLGVAALASRIAELTDRIDL